ncbi:MAG: hypothetical protein GXO73_03580 [Calditrichaeota bacterium]|nr:hypothetical protein [Calditrichota bacterium]
MAAKRVKIALALGGGGARGLAHVGVLRVLAREGFRFDLITGTSMGSVVGAMYAQQGDPDEVEERFRRLLDSDLYHEIDFEKINLKRHEDDFFGHISTSLKERIAINLALSRISLLDADYLERGLQILLEPGRIEDLEVTYAAVAVDLNSGEEAVIARGDIMRAVLASSSVPGFFPPCEYEGRYLVDGAVRATLPVRAARYLGADIVVTVDVSRDLGSEPDLDNIVDILARCHDILADAYRGYLQQEADLLIRPNVGSVHWTKLDLMDELVAEGEKAAEQALPQLTALFEQRKPLWRRLMAKVKRKE